MSHIDSREQRRRRFVPINGAGSGNYVSPTAYDNSYGEWVRLGRPARNYAEWAANWTPPEPGEGRSPALSRDQSAARLTEDIADIPEEIRLRRNEIRSNIGGIGDPKTGGFADIPPDMADQFERDIVSGRARRARGGSQRSALGPSFSSTSAITGGY